MVQPTISVNDAMRVITEKRFRHLPVMEDARIVGVVSSGDLTRSLVEAQEGQIDALIGSVQSLARGA